MTFELMVPNSVIFWLIFKFYFWIQIFLKWRETHNRRITCKYKEKRILAENSQINLNSFYNQ